MRYKGATLRLLVSVRDAREAVDALAGGADVIDAKEPLGGALGAVDAATAREITRYVGARRPVSIVIGDHARPDDAARAAEQGWRCGASIVKVGLAGVLSRRRARDVVRAVRSSARSCATAVVAYADAAEAGALRAEEVVEIARCEGAGGIVLDTFDKSGPGLFWHLRGERLGAIVAAAHATGLFLGMAGRLGAAHIQEARGLGADLFGVRGAVCESQREARLSRSLVFALATRLREGDSAELAMQPA
jgi:uncharacterized protein (UPF0264 family)